MRAIRYSIGFALLFFVALLGSALAAPADKSELPSSDKELAVRKKITEVYRDEYNNAKKPQERVALAMKLIRVGTDTRDDDAAQYVLWRIAKDIAIGAGDYDVAESAIDKMGEHFKIDVLATKTQAIEAASNAKQAVPDYQKLSASAGRLLDQLIADERFDSADKVGEMYSSFAKKSGDGNLLTQSQSRRLQLQRIERAYSDISPDIAVLRGDPANVSANTALGRFRCFTVGNWDIGLPMLARSINRDWSEAAKKDLANPADPVSQSAVADGWWNLSEKETDEVQTAMRHRAAYWYERALPMLTGLPKEAAEKRLGITDSIGIEKTFADQGLDSSNEKAGSKPKAPSLIVAGADREAQDCRFAKDALLVYKLLLADKSVPEEAKDQVKKKLGPLEDAAGKNLARLGRNWVSREELEKSHDQAEGLVREAVDLLALKNDELAKQKLEKASRTDPNSTRADFLLGVMSVCGRNYNDAKSHFMECLRREPQNLCTLNNIALTEVMVSDHQSAIKHWRSAIEIDPTAPELAHNLHRILNQVGLKNLYMPASTSATYSELFGELLKQGAIRESARQGWLYMSPIAANANDVSGPVSQAPDGRPKNLRQTPGSQTSSDSTVITAGATGFVIHPHYVLTNRHVIDTGTSFVITDPENPTGKKLTASIFAKSDDRDLAILRCDELNAPAIPLSTALPKRGSDIMLLGFPEFFDIGTGLKSTRGSIVGLPSLDTDNMCLYDATSNPGNSGGPVCDRAGRVVAVHCVGFKFSGKLAGGIPIQDATRFISQYIPEFHPDNEQRPSMEWPDVDALASKSTVLIQCKGTRDNQLSIDGKLHTECIEDQGCVACHGLGTMRCPDCQNGTVASTQTVVKYREPVTGTSIYENKKIRVPCKTCGGTGLVKCTVCKGNGLDPNLR